MKFVTLYVTIIIIDRRLNNSGGMMSNVTKYILKGISYTIIILVVCFAMLLVGVKLFGVQVYTVLSGSMEPEYKVGSLIYVVDVDIDELEEKDVITFKLTDNVVATHRIEKIDYEENGDRIFTTKGDANDYVDENLVSSDSVIGTPVFTIPYLGYVASFMQMPSGRNFTCVIFVLLMIVVIVIDSITDDKKIKNKSLKMD